MPVHFQLASTPLPTDLPYTNYRDVEIEAGRAVVIDAQNVLGDAGDGIGIMMPPAGPQPVPYAFGVTMEKIRARSNGRVRTQGLVVCKADGPIAPGMRVCMSTVAGKVGWVRAKTPGEPQLGLAQTAAVDGDDIILLVNPATNA
jgi:hypothetical protein